MVKRVSLKGKGADIFFGDYPPPEAEHTTAVPTGTAPDTETDAPPPPKADHLSSDDTTEAVPLSHGMPAQETTQPATTDATGAEEPMSTGEQDVVRNDHSSGDSMQGTKQPRMRASANASARASMLVPIPAVVVETIRKTVKLSGKEVSFVRLTPREKGDLIDIVYAFKRQGYRTSETEINRIAVNYILLDYEANGEDSILAKVLAALLA